MTQHVGGKESDAARARATTAPELAADPATHSAEVPANGRSLRELDSPMRSPAAVLGMQRSLGNRATTQLLRSQTATPGPVSGTSALQRSKESEELMKALATPLTMQLEGNEIEVQDQLAKALDEAISSDLITSQQEQSELNQQYDTEELLQQKTPTEERRLKMETLRKQANQKRLNTMSYNDATYIGAVILTEKIGETTELVKSAKLVDLPSMNDKSGKVTQSLHGSAYHLVEKNGLAPLVISNTFTTMEKAQQLEYFRKAGLPNEKYAIVIEVHYYRNRPTSSTKIHKDTTGETLFVNLSFTNKKKILGPEYIVNPSSDKIYDQVVRQRLPEVFVDDLEAVRKDFKGEKSIKATVLEENGVVAFVDEAIHHKTPTSGPRTASSDGLKTALANVYGEEYADAAKAYKEYKSASKFSLYTFGSYFTNTTAKAHSNDWWLLLEKLPTLKKELNRNDLKLWLPEYFLDRAEEILEQAATDFTSVSLPLEKGKRITIPVRQRDENPLKRQMSMQDLSQYKATASEGGKRSFFRTWVRAVERGKL